jgi:hypothetical protein
MACISPPPPCDMKHSHPSRVPQRTSQRRPRPTVTALSTTRLTSRCRMCALHRTLEPAFGPASRSICARKAREPVPVCGPPCAERGWRVVRGRIHSRAWCERALDSPGRPAFRVTGQARVACRQARFASPKSLPPKSLPYGWLGLWLRNGIGCEAGGRMGLEVARSFAQSPRSRRAVATQSPRSRQAVATQDSVISKTQQH